MITNMDTSISHARHSGLSPITPSCLPGRYNALVVRKYTGLILLVLAALILLALAPTVYAKEALAYGRDFERLSGPSVSPAAAKTPPQVDSTLIAGQAGLYLEQISVLERQAGPYGAGLDEPLFALARVQRASGDVDGALGSYQRALHLIRINEGLYSERQLPLVREVLDLYREIGDYAALDQRYEYFFRLYGGGQPPFDSVRLQAVLEYLRWQREAIALELESPAPERRLLDLYELNKSVIAAVNGDPDVAGQWRIALLESQFGNMYLLQEHIKPKVSESMTGVGGATTRQLYGAASIEEADPLESRLVSLKRTLVSKGRTLVEELLALYPQMEPAQQGRVELLLADWYQWNLMPSRAREHYVRAYALIEASGEPEILETVFAEPVELPDNGAFRRLASVDNAASVGSPLAARFQVSEKGKAVDIVVSVTDETLRGKGIRLRRQLSQVAFRPRYTSAGAQPSEVVKRKYQVFYN